MNGDQPVCVYYVFDLVITVRGERARRYNAGEANSKEKVHEVEEAVKWC